MKFANATLHLVGVGFSRRRGGQLDVSRNSTR